MKPWYYETTQPQLFNEWTWTHFAWGMLSKQYTQSHLVALAGHTLYEVLEGNLFPGPMRDTSMLNHVGDTIAFLAGRVALP